MRVGDYDILRRIGSGAYGKVYLARKGEKDGFRTYYALKRLRVEHAGDEAFERYLLREARHGGLVNHRNLVRIHDVLRVGGEYVLVMDYVEGVTLREVLAPRRDTSEPLPAEVCLEIAAEVLDALDYIHTLVDPEGTESAFVHRDVKPGNIMLTPAGGLRLMDFGVARGEDAEHATQTGELRGTIAYMAPEQAAGKTAGPAADQFAAGLVLLEMLTATPAWGDPKGLGILGKVVQGDVSEGLVRLAATDPVAAILMRMLAPEPGNRFATSGEAAQALRTLRAEAGTPPALGAFVREELQRLQDAPAVEDDAPSWTDSEGDPAGVTWTGQGAGEGTLPPADPTSTGDPPPVAADDAFKTLPLGSGQVHARDLVAAAAAGGDASSSSPSVRPPAHDTGPPTLPVGPPTKPMPAAPAPGAAPPGPPPVAPGSGAGAASSASVGRPPGPPGTPRSASADASASSSAVTGPLRPPVPGGALPPGYGAKSGPAAPSKDGGNFLGAGLIVLMVLLIGGVVALALRPVDAPIREVDADETRAAPPAAGTVATAGGGGPGATAAGDPSEADADAELPGDAAVTEMLIEEDEAEADAVADEVREASARLSDERVVYPDPPAEYRDPGRRDEGAARAEPPPREEATVSARGDEADSGGGLVEGTVIGDTGVRERRAPPRRVDEARPDKLAERDRRAEAEAVESGTGGGDRASSSSPSEADAGPGLRFLSARQQPLGVPLSLRVRPEGFLAQSVTVYYQWRGEGSSGRRKRSLRAEGDGSFALEISASELRNDRLQVWFVAEPGGVKTGSASRPIEVKVR